MKHTLLPLWLLLVSCQDAESLNIPSENLNLSIHKNGRQTAECLIQLGSGEYNQLKSWFSSNERTWDKAPATYLPQKILRSENFKAALYPDYIVINDVWRQPFDMELYQAFDCT
ncbi:hypothetical protein [Agarivorans sp. 1_MG-2023]|uniref:hypothetical protein n=1 Tax=Agarivorans sp. 1_MG-2023 TaxID=3062634 RepID=UPI0026E3A7DF|nr:hypothetical protein [Agarivorans sp. 1_MG-2023]MDO6765811.1 hypothetical protein [Agarivorans sp. 1_MG-2023]